MLVFYRAIPWLVSLLSLGGFILVMRNPALFAGVFAVLVILTVFFYTHLIDTQKHDFGFWNFLLTPTLLLVSSFAFFLFLEGAVGMYVLAGIVSVLQLIYGEHLFFYFHQPSRYRVYTIERVSLVVSVSTVFLLSSALFGLLILVQVPLWILAPLFFLVATLVVYGTLWVSKVDAKRAPPYALVGAVLLTQMFIVLSFLPVAHTTNAAVLTTFLYLFLGLSRADFMGRLTRAVFLRYLFFTIVVSAIILITTKWV